ncbi:glycosyltransferase family 2 protein [Flavobacterium sp.]|jgi:dTDP-glucose pyrophosphorylase|uniref:glycosyltransferase family 2 protein n=1 Tax=Flavobacterium sp. TaxID=239 RepID=UPI0022BD4465|nr:glycosyltransferase family 2 protein [Flavobacterium sp.]MCZ8145984.1 glycosyltransferase family 2 protein [Flavobacterium sp.]MCZ8368098.1 glycosyltransferase family 2 protein [Flavobacterium sp.]
MLKIIIPLAGSSELYTNAGFSYPKPLVEIDGKPMIQIVIEQFQSITEPFQAVFILKDEDVRKFHLDNTIRLLAPNSEIVKLKSDTKGALCSILMTIDSLSDDDRILVLNGDQIINHNFQSILQSFDERKADVGIVTFPSVHPRWSYARIEHGEVVQTAEKNPISSAAIAGFYFFAKAQDFFANAFQCILDDVQINGNFFTSSLINEYILKNQKVVDFGIYKTDYHSFYAPQNLQEFLKAQK